MSNDQNLDRLIELAKNVSQNAYCPYSQFHVGAVIVTDTGEEFAGCNVENASYGLTICAERNAIFQMVAKSQKHIELVVIYTPTAEPAAPCGACRQVLNEFGPQARVVSACEGTARLDTTVNQLLPSAFGPHSLGQPSLG